MAKDRRKLQGRAEDVDKDDLEEEVVGVYGISDLSDDAARVLSEGERGWNRVLSGHTGVLEHVLGDMIRFHAAQPGKVGARPMPREEDVDVAFLFWGES